MRISWRALAAAPVVIPAAYAATLLATVARPTRADDAAFAFAALFLPGLAVSYASTAFMLIPALWLLSRRWTLNGWAVAATGAVLGVVSGLPVIYLFWLSSGPDSGPPVEPFLAAVAVAYAESAAAAFPLGGAVTAALYWVLGGGKAARA